MTLGKASLTAFLTGFGPGVGDLRLKAQQMRLTGTVALPTHMLHTSVSADVVDSGDITIADLTKVLAFIKSLPKDSMVTLWQPKNSALRLLSGKTSLNLPTTDYVRSYKSVGQAMTLLKEAESNLWKSWAGRALTCYGKIDSESLYQVKSSEKIVGKDLPITCEFDTSEALLSINIGNKGGAKMSIGIDLEDVDGPSEVCKSSFGSWLPHALMTIPQGTVELYTADDFVAIFRHTTRDHLLLVMDKRSD